jgi:hypothetical protein
LADKERGHSLLKTSDLGSSAIMSTRTSIPFMLAGLMLFACGESSDDGQGSAGSGGAAGESSGGAGAAAETGGAGGASGTGNTGGAGAGGVAGMMMSSGGTGAGSAGIGGGGSGSGGNAGSGGEAAASGGGSGGASGVGGESGMGSLQEDLGPCCEAHEGPGCQDQATAECVCAMIPGCCTGNWEEACAIMATQKHCEPGVRSCVCGSGPEEWQLQDQCCMGEWSALCQSTAVQKCGAKDSCF